MLNGHIITFKHTEKIRASSKNIPYSPHFLFGGDISTCKAAFQLCNFSLFQGNQLPNSVVDYLLDDKQYLIHFLTNLHVEWQLIFLSLTQVNLTNQIASDHEIGNLRKKSVFYKRNFFKSHLLASTSFFVFVCLFVFFQIFIEPHFCLNIHDAFFYCLKITTFSIFPILIILFLISKSDFSSLCCLPHRPVDMPVLLSHRIPA